MFHSRSSSWESLNWVVKFPLFWKETNCSSFPCQHNFGPQLQPPRAFGGGGGRKGNDGHLPYGWRRGGGIYPKRDHTSIPYKKPTTLQNPPKYLSKNWRKRPKMADQKKLTTFSVEPLLFRKWSFQTGGMGWWWTNWLQLSHWTPHYRRSKCQKKFHQLLFPTFPVTGGLRPGGLRPGGLRPGGLRPWGIEPTWLRPWWIEAMVDWGPNWGHPKI